MYKNNDNQKRARYRRRWLNAGMMYVTLCAAWYVLSGFDHTFFIVLGLLSSLMVVTVAWSMDIVGDVRAPVYCSWRVPGYFLWLCKEIILTGLSVTYKVWIPGSRISPVLGWVDAPQKSENAKAVYGNSITLTPGTVCTDVEGDIIQLHALTQEGMADMQKGTMARKVTRSMDQ